MAPATAVILCGGAGERLGGIDKPLRLLAGRPLIEHVLARVAPQARSVLVSANRNQERYAIYGRPLVSDGAYAGCGPLAGIAAALAAIEDADLLCVPGDAPLLPPDLRERLDRIRRTRRASIAYAHDGVGPQPLCCLIERGQLGALRDYLDAGGRTPREWFARNRAVPVDCGDWPRWAWSLNTEAEWAAAEARLARAGNPA